MRESASIGNDLADELLFFALVSNPVEFDGLLDEILNEDDTDADLSNGTPHIDAILYAFENHKIYSSDPDVPPAAPKDFDYSGNDGSNHPIFTWDANTEPDLDGYNIYRRKMGEQNFTKLNVSVITGTTYTDLSVTYRLDGAAAEYYVKAIDDDDNESSRSDYAMVGIQPKLVNPDDELTATLSIPDDYRISQNFPNPFNPETQIRFGLPEDIKVTIEVYNLYGQKVAKLADGYYEAGYHSVAFNGANQPSGVYFYRVVAGDFQDIKRMFLIK